MTTRQDIVDEARKWVGTPVIHQGRLLGLECDCLGLITSVGHKLKLLDNSSLIKQNYVYGFGDKDMLPACDALLNKVEVLTISSIVIFWFTKRKIPQHMGIITQLPGRLGLIHAHFNSKKVVEHSYDEFWVKRALAFYNYKGVEDG